MPLGLLLWRQVDQDTGGFSLFPLACWQLTWQPLCDVTAACLSSCTLSNTISEATSQHRQNTCWTTSVVRADRRQQSLGADLLHVIIRGQGRHTFAA